MPKTVEVLPFLKPCPDSEKRLVDCGDGVLVGDIIKELATQLNVKASSLGLIKEMGAGIRVVLHNKETPPPTVMVKGARTLATIPSKIEVKGKVMPTTLTKEEALAIQADTMTYYNNELVRAQLKQLQAKTIEKWTAAPSIDPTSQREYNIKLREILQPQQQKFFPKHGFEATSKGMALMQGIFNTYSDDQEIQDNVNKINAIVGTDYSWAPAEIQLKLFATPAGAAAAAPVEEEPAMEQAPEVQE